MNLVRKILALCGAAILWLPLSAQFHSNGASPWLVGWRQLEGESVRVIAPKASAASARSVVYFMDSLTNHVCYGLGPKGMRPLDMPVVLHSHSSLSNGIAIVAPQRIEMCLMPAVESYATPWLRQLSVHEYRHAAQYAALFGGTLPRWLYYLLGEQSRLILTGVMPFWWIEGDAVDAETQASLYGRGLQPSFTMHYRAVGREILEGKNPDVWFGGSYNRYVPSHYNLGYQMVTTANTLQGRYAWGEVMEYASRRPYTITPFEWGMRNHLGMTTEGLFRATFERLNDHWESLPAREDSARRVESSEEREQGPWVEERYPLWVDSTRVVMLRSSFDRTERFVEVDVTTGRERELFPTGAISSRPAIVGGMLYWTEYCQISSFSQHIGSVMRCAPIDGSRGPRRTLRREAYVLYPTEFEGEVAYVRYNTEGTYTVVCGRGEVTLPEGEEIHGLASAGQRLYMLTTSSRGMAIEYLAPTSEWERGTVKKASRVTLKDLRAEGEERLIFGSIASGYDEIHAIDVTTGVEERLTTSRYGSFYGALSPGGERVALALYDAEGYHLAVDERRAIERVEYSTLPANVVNPESYRWENFVCIDTLEYGEVERGEMEARTPAKRYHPLSHLISIHSWAPAYYRPDQLMSGNLSSFRFGVTATSQSLLSDAVTSMGLFWLPSGVVGTNFNMKYIGLPLKVELNARLDSGSSGGFAASGVMMRDGEYHAKYNHSDREATLKPTSHYYSLYGRLYLPLVLSHSYFSSVLTPSVELSRNNNRIYSTLSEEYYEGVTSVAATLQWNSYTRSAYRNVQPRWGAAVVVGAGKILHGIETPTTFGAFARAYVPGFGANDGFTLKASWQDIMGNGPVGYALDFGWMQPRGMRTALFPDERIGGGVEYNTPLCYPDVGWSGVVLLKRVRATLFAEGLYGRLWTKDGSKRWGGSVTFGTDVWLDTSWLRLPDQGDLTFKLGLYVDPNHWNEPTITGGLNLNF